jgi:TRAP-type C4-dicarboxylate transport system substrate-binding protein
LGNSESGKGRFFNSPKFHEVQKYMTVVNYQWGAMTVAMNLDYYNRLPADIQNVLVAAAKDLAPYARKLIEEETWPT